MMFKSKIVKVSRKRGLNLKAMLTHFNNQFEMFRLCNKIAVKKVFIIVANNIVVIYSCK